MVNWLVDEYTFMAKKRWGKPLAKHGFTKIEEDISSDGQWHNGQRDFGKVAFWRSQLKQADGFVVNPIKYIVDLRGYNSHGENAYAIGGAHKYFTDLGFKTDTSESRSEPANITINGRSYEALKYTDASDLYELLRTKPRIKQVA